MDDERIPAHFPPNLHPGRRDAEPHDGKVVGLGCISDLAKRVDKHGFIAVERPMRQVQRHTQIACADEQTVNCNRPGGLLVLHQIGDPLFNGSLGNRKE